MKISVFTVCMPEYTPEEGARLLAKIGYDGVEWRVTAVPKPGAPVRNFWDGNRCTLAPETLPAQADKIRKLCARHKLAMPCLGTYLGYQNLALIERVMQGAARMKVKQFRVDVARYDSKTSYGELLEQAVKGWMPVVELGRQYGVRPLAEIHMGTIVTSASAARRFIEHFRPEEAVIILDPGNMVYEGFENLQMGLEILGPYLAHVHVKNAARTIRTGDPDGNLRWVCDSATLRGGQVNWRDTLKILRSSGYDGWISLEDFVPGDTEVKLRDNLAYLQQLLA